jgi:formamidopyrimidine-DNA glycosylase
MPELPDVEVYIEGLRSRIGDATLQKVRVASPFVLRSVEPPLSDAEGRRVEGLRRLGKRIVLDLEGDLHLVLHLMIAGRLRWESRGARVPARLGLAAFDFTTGTLLLTEASKRRRAAIYLVAGEAALEEMDPGGIDVLAADLETFAEALRRENHTLKRTLTDPRVFSGIGNAYSDEILHAARLSPIAQTGRLTSEEVERLHRATQTTLTLWRDRLLAEFAERFPGPGDVTAFRPDFAVHGRYRKPCPVCGKPVQRIRYAENETNYCAECQTGGRLLADRALSRLLKTDWPRSIDDLDEAGIRRLPAPPTPPARPDPAVATVVPTPKRPRARGPQRPAKARES